MKKAIIITVIIILILFAILVSIPIFFKGQLLEKTKSTINKNVDAQVEFADLRLSMFRNFPKVSVIINDIVITGKGEFSGDTLLNAPSISLKMSILSLFSKTNKSIDEIELLQPKLNFIVAKTEKANWDLVKTPEGPQSQKEESFDLQLDNVIIKNAEVIYDDRDANTLLRFEDINLDLEGQMYGSSAKLQANGKIERFSLNYDGSNYISKVSLETKTLLDINYETMNISIIENELMVNRLPMNVTGLIQAPGDSIFFNLNFKTSESDFESFLALVPPDYDHYLENMKTSGSASISGTFNGFYYNETYPALNLDLNISGGNLHYADLPEEIKNIRASATIAKPQGGWDLTVIKVTEAHAEIRNNPLDLTLTLKNLVSDPWFDGAFVGKINFEHLKGALPLDSVNMSGIIDANLFAKGTYSAIEKEQYKKIKADGIVILNNYTFQSPKLTQVVKIPKGQMDFTPESVNLSEFQMRVGQSDFNLTGKVSNYLNYYLSDGVLNGSLQLNSQQVNLNEMLRLQVVKEEIQEAKQAPTSNSQNQNVQDNTNPEILAFDIPKNIDFTFRSSINTAVLDQMTISNIKGLITAQNGKLVLNDLNMRMLDGELKLTGSYENTTQNQPLFDFGFDISNFDIPVMTKTLTGIRKMMPVINNSEGRLSSTMKINGQFDEMLKLKMPTVDGSGVFTTENLQIINSPVLMQISSLLNPEKLKSVTVDDFKANFTIDNGTILLKPFKTKIAGQDATISGNLNTQNLLDMKLDFQVQRDAFGNDIQNILSVLPGEQNIQVIPASVRIQGPVNEPEVKVDLSEARKKITEEVTKSTKEDLQKTLNKVGEGLKKLFR